MANSPNTIRNRWTQAIIYTAQSATTMATAVIEAVAAKVQLVDAYLEGLKAPYGAYLRGADLRGADLRGAYLRGAYLRGADLSGADLSGAYLRGADRSYTIVSARCAQVGPVGPENRVVQGFICRPKDDEKAVPILVLVCGCFMGTEDEYRLKVASLRKEEAGREGADAWMIQRLAAFDFVRSVAVTWGVAGYPPEIAVEAVSKSKGAKRKASRKGGA